MARQLFFVFETIQKGKNMKTRIPYTKIYERFTSYDDYGTRLVRRGMNFEQFKAAVKVILRDMKVERS